MTKIIARRIKITAGGESSYVKGFHPHPFHRALIHMGYKPSSPHSVRSGPAAHAAKAGYQTAYHHAGSGMSVAVKHDGKSTHIARFHADGHKSHDTKLKNHDHLHAWHDSYVHQE